MVRLGNGDHEERELENDEDDRTEQGAGQPSGKLGAAIAAAALLALALSGPASAKQVQLYKFEKFFNGADSTAGAFTTGLGKVEINQNNGNVYTAERRGSDLQVSQFNAAGAAQLWSRPPRSQLLLGRWRRVRRTGHGLGRLGPHQRLLCDGRHEREKRFAPSTRMGP